MIRKWGNVSYFSDLTKMKEAGMRTLAIRTTGMGRPESYILPLLGLILKLGPSNGSSRQEKRGQTCCLS